ncbi:MAG TPA: hypothetical protein VFU73_01280 [Actinocrinis sp.]|nr:hypothetical protein [Actinocrinis sp.]
MRRIAVRTSLAVLVPALLAINAGVAAADSAPAPDCESSSSQFFCDAASPVSPVTWTQTISIFGFSSTSTFSGPTILHSGCELRAAYTFSFTYVSGGVTFTSGSTRFICTSSPPE